MSRSLSCVRAHILTSPTGDPRRAIAYGWRTVASRVPRIAERRCLASSRSLASPPDLLAFAVVARSLLGLLTLSSHGRCLASSRSLSGATSPSAFTVSWHHVADHYFVHTPWCTVLSISLPGGKYRVAHGRPPPAVVTATIQLLVQSWSDDDYARLHSPYIGHTSDGENVIPRYSYCDNLFGDGSGYTPHSRWRDRTLPVDHAAFPGSVVVSRQTTRHQRYVRFTTHC